MAGAECEHGETVHCCECEDCARFEREPGWCIRCGEYDPEIGFADVCTNCELILIRPSG